MESLLSAAKRHIVTLMQIQNSVRSIAGNQLKLLIQLHLFVKHMILLLKKFKYLSR